MLALSGVLVLGALAIGPELMQLLFGSGFVVARSDLAILSAGVGTYLAAATLGQAVLARARAVSAAAIWASAAAAFVVVELTLPGSSFHRVSVAFTVATGLACAALAILAVRPGRSAHD
jgi:hypothetical protein